MYVVNALLAAWWVHRTMLLVRLNDGVLGPLELEMVLSSSILEWWYLGHSEGFFRDCLLRVARGVPGLYACGSAGDTSANLRQQGGRRFLMGGLLSGKGVLSLIPLAGPNRKPSRVSSAPSA